MTLKELIKSAVEQLLLKGKEEFTASEICEEALRIDPSRKRRSILGTLSGLVVGRKHPVYREKDQFLEKVSHGVYKLHQPLRKRRKKPRKTPSEQGDVI